MYMYLIYEDGCWSLFADVLIENVRTINLPVLSIRFCKIISNSDIFVIHVHVAITNKRTLNVWYVYHIRVCLKCAWNGHISMIMSIFYKQTPPPNLETNAKKHPCLKVLLHIHLVERHCISRILINTMQNQYFTAIVDTVSTIVDSIHKSIHKWLIGPLLVLAIYTLTAKPILCNSYLRYLEKKSFFLVFFFISNFKEIRNMYGSDNIYKE